MNTRSKTLPPPPAGSTLRDLVNKKKSPSKKTRDSSKDEDVAAASPVNQGRRSPSILPDPPPHKAAVKPATRPLGTLFDLVEIELKKIKTDSPGENGLPSLDTAAPSTEEVMVGTTLEAKTTSDTVTVVDAAVDEANGKPQPSETGLPPIAQDVPTPRTSPVPSLLVVAQARTKEESATPQAPRSRLASRLSPILETPTAADDDVGLATRDADACTVIVPNTSLVRKPRQDTPRPGTTASARAANTHATPAWLQPKHTFKPPKPELEDEGPSKRAHSPGTPSPAGPEDLFDMSQFHKRPRLTHEAWPPLPCPASPPIRHTSLLPQLLAEQPEKPPTLSREAKGKGRAPPTLARLPDAEILDHEWDELLADTVLNGLVPEAPGTAPTPGPSSAPANSIAAIVASGTLETAGAASRNTLEYTRTPSPGWPRPQGLSPIWLFRNLIKWQIQWWEENYRNGTSLLAVPYGRGFLDDCVAGSGALPISGTITSVLAQFLEVRRVNLVAPIPENEIRTRNSAPFAGLITDLTAEQAETLVEQFCFSTSRLTFFIFPFGLDFSTFVCSIERLPLAEEDLILHLVVSQLAVPRNRRLLLAIARRLDGIQDLSDDEIVRTIGKAIWVEFRDVKGPTGCPTPVYNIYIETISDDVATWDRIRRLFRQMTFEHPGIGRGRVASGQGCSGCHSVDHYRSRCPFQSIAGWLGPVVRDTPPGPPVQNAPHMPPPPPPNRYRGYPSSSRENK